MTPRTPNFRPTLRRTLLAVAVAVAVLAPAAEARGALLLPPGSKIFSGVTDTGNPQGVHDWAQAVGRYPPVMETYHPWGNSLDRAMPRWREVRTRPMLHITTAQDDGTEVITPRGIAFGWGDDYLLYLNRQFSQERFPAYIRPMGEPNRCLNPYAAVDCAGDPRPNEYASRWYRRAFQRMYLLLHGGRSKAVINGWLERAGLPPIRDREETAPPRLPKAPISVIWSPLPGGSPRARGNFPAYFYPGDRFTDWVGTDFYSRYPHWRDLNRFYIRFAHRRLQPFALTEWGLWGEDAPLFTRRVIAWVLRRRLARMMVYYQDFGTTNEFRIQNFPQSAGVISRWISRPLFPQRAPRAPEPVPDSGGMTPAASGRSR